MATVRFSQLAPLAAVAVLAALTFWLLQTNLTPPAQHAAAQKSHTPDYFADNLSISMLDETGRTQYRINAATMVHYLDDANTDMTKPAIRAFTPGKPEVTSVALRGTINGDGTIVDLFGNASVVRDPGAGDPGMRADSQHFRFFVNDDVVQTEKPVKLLRGQSIVTADGMIYNNTTREMQLSGHVRGQLAASEVSAGGMSRH